MENRHWRDKWSQADLDLLVHKRDVEKKFFSVIAKEMQRPEGSVHRRYVQIVAAREPAPSIAPDPKPKRLPFHQQMGIDTYIHRQAILDDPRAGRRYDEINHVWSHNHAYRENITLVKVFA